MTVVFLFINICSSKQSLTMRFSFRQLRFPLTYNPPHYTADNAQMLQWCSREVLGLRMWAVSGHSGLPRMHSAHVCACDTPRLDQAVF